MSKLKDYKNKIKDWPGKKDVEKHRWNCRACPNRICHEHDEIQAYNEAHEIFSNLEFNPAELVKLDADKILVVIKEYVYKVEALNEDWNWRGIALAVANSKDVVKTTGGLIHSSKVVYKDNC